MQDARRVVVIGTGPAGAAAARALVAAKIPVLLLESGDEVPEGARRLRMLGSDLVLRRAAYQQKRLDFVASGDPKTEWYQELVLGGLSNGWASVALRFSPEDFTEGRRLDEKYEWPVRYEELVPHYQSIERLVGMRAGSRSVSALPAGEVMRAARLSSFWRPAIAAARTVHRDLVALPVAKGPKLFDVSSKAAPFNSYVDVLSGLARAGKIELRSGMHVLSLEWDGARKRVAAALVHNRATNATERIEASAFVVACGAVGSNALLLCSRSPDFPDGLGNSHDVLGRYIHDHPIQQHRIHLDRRAPRGGLYFTRRDYAVSEPLRASGATFYPARWGALERKPGKRLPALSVDVLSSREFRSNIYGSMIPRAEFRIRLDESAHDKMGIPRLDIHLRYEDEVLRSQDEGRNALLEVLDRVGIRATASDIDNSPPGSSVHYGGGVRMHKDPRHGMLDGKSRMHAVRNVAVVDASAFPTSVEKKPTLTVMALAERAAVKLAEDLRNGTLE